MKRSWHRNLLILFALFIILSVTIGESKEIMDLVLLIETLFLFVLQLIIYISGKSALPLNMHTALFTVPVGFFTFIAHTDLTVDMFHGWGNFVVWVSGGMIGAIAITLSLITIFVYKRIKNRSV